MGSLGKSIPCQAHLKPRWFLPGLGGVLCEINARGPFWGLPCLLRKDAESARLNASGWQRKHQMRECKIF